MITDQANKLRKIVSDYLKTPRGDKDRNRLHTYIMKKNDLPADPEFPDTDLETIKDMVNQLKEKTKDLERNKSKPNKNEREEETPLYTIG